MKLFPSFMHTCTAEILGFACQSFQSPGLDARNWSGAMVARLISPDHSKGSGTIHPSPAGPANKTLCMTGAAEARLSSRPRGPEIQATSPEFTNFSIFEFQCSDLFLLTFGTEKSTTNLDLAREGQIRLKT